MNQNTGLSNSNFELIKFEDVSTVERATHLAIRNIMTANLAVPIPHILREDH
eukprot:gene13577-16054_t